MMNEGADGNSDFTPQLYAALVRMADTMPEPKPGDWLFEMKEEGQSFEEFIGGKWPRPDSDNRTLYVQPLESFSGNSSPDVALLRQFAEAYFMLPVTVLPAIDIDTVKITSRANPYTRNKQLLTTDILDFLAWHFPRDAFCFTGITMQDLYPEPSWNFVFGQASLVRQVGVFSFARYDPSFNRRHRDLSVPARNILVLRRSCKVLAHEIGHMFGLYHCIYYRCCMNGSNNLQESDGKPIHLCPVCLKKLHYSIGFSVRERYRKLRAFYHSVGFEEEAAAIDRRLESINDTVIMK